MCVRASAIGYGNSKLMQRFFIVILNEFISVRLSLKLRKYKIGDVYVRYTLFVLNQQFPQDMFVAVHYKLFFFSLAARLNFKIDNTRNTKKLMYLCNKPTKKKKNSKSLRTHSENVSFCCCYEYLIHVSVHFASAVSKCQKQIYYKCIRTQQ